MTSPLQDPPTQRHARVLVSHPHAGAVANETARALAREGVLAGYLAGLSAAEHSLRGDLLRRLRGSYPVLANRIVPGLTGRQLHSLAPVEALARVVGGMVQRLGVASPGAYEAMFLAHDAATALWPWPAGTTAVYAFEDGAAFSFGRAAARGMERLYHLASPHHRSVAEVWRRERSRWPGAMASGALSEPGWKRRRKDRELELSTRVTVASTYAKSCLEHFGSPSAPISVVPYGFPVDQFRPRRRCANGPFTALAVGTHDLRKGTPYLLAAWKRAALPDARLLLVGRLALSRSFLGDYAGCFEHLPHLPRTRLPDVYAGADVLVFPTLSDGFGLVILEAMSCGVPVLTTECGGGPDCITDGAEGWLVPAGQVEPLVETLRRLASDRELGVRAGRAARARAEAWSWREAGHALASVIAPRPAPPAGARTSEWESQ